jgi:hypothetical protein
LEEQRNQNQFDYSRISTSILEKLREMRFSKFNSLADFPIPADRAEGRGVWLVNEQGNLVRHAEHVVRRRSRRANRRVTSLLCAPHTNSRCADA